MNGFDQLRNKEQPGPERDRAMRIADEDAAGNLLADGDPYAPLRHSNSPAARRFEPKPTRQSDTSTYKEYGYPQGPSQRSRQQASTRRNRVSCPYPTKKNGMEARRRWSMTTAAIFLITGLGLTADGLAVSLSATHLGLAQALFWMAILVPF